MLVNNAGIMPVGRFIDEDDATAIADGRHQPPRRHPRDEDRPAADDRPQPRPRRQHRLAAGKYGAPGGATYSATKHAVIGLTEAVRGELHLERSAVELSYVMPYLVNTELGSGTDDARGFKKLEPSDVADAIVDALKHGVVDVWVPSASRATHRVTAPAAAPREPRASPARSRPTAC